MNKQLLQRTYARLKNCADVARKLNVSKRAVYYWMDKHGLERRSNTSTGYRTKSGNGYILTFVGVDARGSTKHGYVYEHRKVVEDHLQRELDTTEHIHHINGDKTDNRIENLKIVSSHEHQKLHRCGLRGKSQKNIDAIKKACLAGATSKTLSKKFELSCPTVQKIIKQIETFTCPCCQRKFKIFKAFGVHIRRTHSDYFQRQQIA